MKKNVENHNYVGAGALKVVCFLPNFDPYFRTIRSAQKGLNNIYIFVKLSLNTFNTFMTEIPII